MNSIVRLYSNKKGEISRFLNDFLGQNLQLDNDLEWEKNFENPIEIVDIIGAFIENNDLYEINMWISIDKDCFINVTDDNADELIRYLYERFPY
ncbi:MAG: hypothetical protein U0O04_04700 [Clostridia bacterium]|jgi:hypothetical protein|nr:putative uncharacterized protein [Clostridium sp. CAG:571]HJJ07413.1 hypothetical protein [Clostridiaceae bacterium]HJJ14690.1 hypothetical protein [Clostridiaceae bacterium]